MADKGGKPKSRHLLKLAMQLSKKIHHHNPPWPAFDITVRKWLHIQVSKGFVLLENFLFLFSTIEAPLCFIWCFVFQDVLKTLLASCNGIFLILI
jgi:hypothetical protein